MSSVVPPPPVAGPVLSSYTADATMQAFIRSCTFDRTWSGWFRNLFNVLSPGVSVTISLAKLTPGGANGQLIFTNGIVTAFTAPT